MGMEEGKDGVGWMEGMEKWRGGGEGIVLPLKDPAVPPQGDPLTCGP